MRPKRSAPLIAAVVLLLACSSGSSNPTASASGDGVAPGATTSIVIGADGSASVVVEPSSPTEAPTSPPPGGDGGGGSPTIDANGAPGSFAPGILSPTYSTEVDLDVRSQSGADPQQPSIDHVVSVLGDVSGKPVNVRRGATIGGGARSWSASDVRALADDPSSPRQGGGKAVLHLLFVHGSFGGDDSVLGVAVRGDTAAIFVDQVNASSTPLVGSGGIEVAVVTHEAGHLLGLVDLYLHTGRQDPDHPGHSTNQNSVMYWAVESSLVADLLHGGPPKEFDSADRADLNTIRNSG